MDKKKQKNNLIKDCCFLLFIFGCLGLILWDLARNMQNEITPKHNNGAKIAFVLEPDTNPPVERR